MFNKACTVEDALGVPQYASLGYLDETWKHNILLVSCFDPVLMKEFHADVRKAIRTSGGDRASLP